MNNHLVRWLGGWVLATLLAIAQATYTGIRDGDWVPLLLALVIMFVPPLGLALGSAGDRDVAAAAHARAGATRAGVVVVSCALAVFTANFASHVGGINTGDAAALAAGLLATATVSLLAVRRVSRTGVRAASVFAGGVAMTLALALGVLAWSYVIRQVPYSGNPKGMSTVEVIAMVTIFWLTVSAVATLLVVVIVHNDALGNPLRWGASAGTAFVLAMSSCGVGNQALLSNSSEVAGSFDPMFSSFGFAGLIWLGGLIVAGGRDEAESAL